MENFKLFMGCLGNGITVCNKAVREYGDYKKVAHISEKGNIKFYVSDGYIPADAMEKIRNAAERQKESYRKYWESLDVGRKYEIILSSLCLEELLDFLNGEKMPMEEAAKKLEPGFLSRD